MGVQGRYQILPSDNLAGNPLSFREGEGGIYQRRVHCNEINGAVTMATAAAAARQHLLLRARSMYC